MQQPTASQEPPTTIAPRPLRPPSQTSISSPSFVSSRPASPSSPHGSLSRPHPHIRRPSSSTSSSSRRPYLSPDPSLPQRLPRSAPADAAAFAELHQELEAEQEAQVNRLLNMIRIQSMQAGSTDGDTYSNAATVDSSSTRAGRPRSPMSATTLSRRGSNRLSRDGSYYRPRSVSRASSPGLTAGGDSASENSTWIGTRDPAFYIAENQMVKRENDMLRRRIRELEKAVAELTKASASGTANDVTPPAVPISEESEITGLTAAA
ncbi:hypothetical protein K440DRAFT_620356 [Wilcoxina mikolae CBS 423.85]|nr:hypothetical protein K440DRAFT_620356 [Wilcoxina mikolae CBS 423.85]